ncbi:hypothetical protein TIFTF001_031707 [Ficus carica]|uniref:Uncharacterized protein n=1 Tax=Ficus carica TaxID=3494 RepID=A0AA88DVF2_FICCA|nr:hypothetical protein TIFTF001_031707 [Ficus carica]
MRKIEKENLKKKKKADQREKVVMVMVMVMVRRTSEVRREKEIPFGNRHSP